METKEILTYVILLHSNTEFRMVHLDLTSLLTILSLISSMLLESYQTFM